MERKKRDEMIKGRERIEMGGGEMRKGESEEERGQEMGHGWGLE